MKTRMGFGLLLLATLGTGTGQGQDQSTKDSDNGYWWVKQSETFKLGFSNGYSLALSNEYNRITLMCLGEKNLGIQTS